MNKLSLQNIIKNSAVKEISYHEENGIVVQFSGIDVRFINLIEKIMETKLPTICITSIIVSKNTSSLCKYDEEIAHRLKSIPLRYNGPELEYRNDSGMSTKNTLMMRLYKKATESACKVYSSDLRYIPGIAESSLQPVHEDIIIAMLKQGEEIDVLCYCEKGTASSDVLFSPTVVASHRFMPTVAISGRVSYADSVSIAELCPVNVFDIEDGHLVVKRQDNCTSCGICSKQSDMVKTSLNRNEVRMTLECTKTRTEKELLIEALDYLIDKCDKVIDSVNVG